MTCRGEACQDCIKRRGGEVKKRGGKGAGGEARLSACLICDRLIPALIETRYHGSMESRILVFMESRTLPRQRKRRPSRHVLLKLSADILGLFS